MKFSVKTGPNYDDLKSAIEKISQTGKRWRYLHQTDFASRIPGSHKNTQFGGVLWGQFASANVRTEQPGRGKTDHAYTSDTHQPRAGRQFLLAYQNQWWSLFQHTPRQSQNHAYNSNKKEDAAHQGCILLSIIWICTCPFPTGSWTAVPALRVSWQKEIHNTPEGYFCCHHPAHPAAQTAWT